MVEIFVGRRMRNGETNFAFRNLVSLLGSDAMWVMSWSAIRILAPDRVGRDGKPIIDHLRIINSFHFHLFRLIDWGIFH